MLTFAKATPTRHRPAARTAAIISFGFPGPSPHFRPRRWPSAGCQSRRSRSR
jgi:hypothetical protein